MDLSGTAQATLLLTSYFSKPDENAPTPLSVVEWGRFAFWLKEAGHTPGDLLTARAGGILQAWDDDAISYARCHALLRRGHSLALALDKWQRAGLWVLTRSDAAYPWRLKKRLKTQAPPVLFGCGNAGLLNAECVAVAGSHNAVDDDVTFAAILGSRMAQHGYGLVAGAQAGVEEAAMQGAMLAGGDAIGVVPGGLLMAATSSKWRRGLMNNHLVLVSPFYPEADVGAGNTLVCNRYRYCLADAAVVVHAGLEGDTINGALENLKQGWVPLWVKPDSDPASGNTLLTSHGGHFSASDAHAIDIASLINSAPV